MVFVYFLRQNIEMHSLKLTENFASVDKIRQ